jgi:hypothetical protein
MNSQFEKEEQYLEDQLASGEITPQEFNEEMRELQRSFRDAAEEAAQAAYDDVMRSW